MKGSCGSEEGGAGLEGVGVVGNGGGEGEERDEAEEDIRHGCFMLHVTCYMMCGQQRSAVSVVDQTDYLV